MRIGFAARWSPLDKKSWSGITYSTYREISRQHEVEIFGYKMPWYLREWLTMQKSLNRKRSGRETVVEFLKAYAKNCSRHLQKELKKKPVDLLFVSGSPQMISYIQTDVPIIFMVDATFKQLNGYYAYYSHLPAYNLRQGLELDKRTFQNATHCLLTSEWVKNSAVQDYGIDPQKITIAPMGANIESVPELSPQVNPPDSCKLLFLGVEWERKGGPIVLDAFYHLQKRGLNPQLHIIGCVPPLDLSAEKNITVIPFLDKNKEEDRRQLQSILAGSDFLFVPTRAECAGAVYSEASAFGVPSIATDTGGVSSIVQEGVNGYLLPPEAGGDVYAEKIASVIAEPGLKQQLRLSSRARFESELSWSNWIRTFNRIAGTITGL